MPFVTIRFYGTFAYKSLFIPIGPRSYPSFGKSANPGGAVIDERSPASRSSQHLHGETRLGEGLASQTQSLPANPEPRCKGRRLQVNGPAPSQALEGRLVPRSVVGIAEQLNLGAVRFLRVASNPDIRFVEGIGGGDGFDIRAKYPSKVSAIGTAADDRAVVDEDPGSRARPDLGADILVTAQSTSQSSALRPRCPSGKALDIRRGKGLGSVSGDGIEQMPFEDRPVDLRGALEDDETGGILLAMDAQGHIVPRLRRGDGQRLSLDRFPYRRWIVVGDEDRKRICPPIPRPDGEGDRVRIAQCIGILGGDDPDVDRLLPCRRGEGDGVRNEGDIRIRLR